MTLRAPNGHVLITDENDKVLLEADTVQCVHCGQHWYPQPGSKKVRGFCSRCNGPICGPKCQYCVPIEQQLANMEAGLSAIETPRLILPTSVW